VGKADAMKTRDMTRREFTAALKRNGFKHEFLFWFEDTTGQTPDIHYPGIFQKNGKTMRRATISRLIKHRDAELKRLMR
jgi:hypothetical protein